ncbi:SUF system Fe-S cluster assembly protein [Pseudemcibacter aquimaris]|nr:SUF system Fe-S cluster assembly protein [Pseudemcibacter aquimaris]
MSAEEKKALEMKAADALREIYDPEIPVNIYELGLIYDIDVDNYADVVVTMTLTSPHCPVAESMPGEVEYRVREVEGVGDVKVALVWEPPWDMSMMSEAARLEMGFM